MLLIGVTLLKLVLMPKTWLNAAGKNNINCMKFNQMKHEPSACAPDSAGVVELAAVWAFVHKSLAD